MRNNKTAIKKYFVITVAQIIVGIGCGFLVKSGMGNDPFGVMVSGLARVTGINYGTMNNIINLAIFFILLLFYRKRLSFTTLICSLVVGWTIDPMLVLLSRFTPPVIVNNFVYPLVGCFILSVGVAITLCVNFGAGITDNLILMIADFRHKTYAFGCYLCYIIFFLAGFVLGGVWGYATVVAIVLNGKIIDFFIPIFEKNIAVWANK